MRASLVQRYLAVVSRHVRRLRRDIEGWYAASPPSTSDSKAPALTPSVGTLIDMNAVPETGSDRHRELRAFTRLKSRLEFLTHASSDIGRIYYRSDQGQLYVTPSIPRGFQDAFSKFSTSPSKGTSDRWVVRRADIFGIGETRTTLWIELPVLLDERAGVLAARVKLDKVRPLFTAANSVGEFYLTNENNAVQLGSRIADRFSSSPAPVERIHARVAAPHADAIGGGLRVVHRYPEGEPYLAAARASLVPWLILVMTAGMTGVVTQRALRSELAERRRAEAELRDACDRQRNLSARLRSLANQLTTVQHRERKRLASLLHDDLQQLLVATRMKLGLAKKNDDDLEEADALVSNAIDVSRDLTQQLRPPALYEAGLVPALRSLAEQMQSRYSIEITVDATKPDSLEGLSDEVKALLFEGVRELVFNIVKHAEASSATIKLRPARKRLRISVVDSGKGFDMVALDHPSSASLGFGLFSIEERLRAIGGELAISSTVGRGTAVRLTLPLGAPSEEVEGSTGELQDASRSGVDGVPQPGSTASDGRPQVLIVDDHAVVRQSLANALKADSRLAVVGEASSGAEAIEAVERCQPEIILMDVDMPDTSGIEATECIHRRWPSIAIFGLSVLEETAVAEAMREAGATCLLSKSIELDVMIACVSGQADEDHATS